MRVIYYRKLLKWDVPLTPTDFIIYDFLLMKSVITSSELYYRDGTTICLDALDEHLSSNENKMDLYSISRQKIAEELGISVASVYNSMKHLKENKLLSDVWITCGTSILRGGYFELRMDLKHEINGKLLVFYSWLCDRANNFIVDAFRNKMSEYFNDSPQSIHNMLQRLYKLGFVEREEKSNGIYGKLKLLK